MKQSIQFLHNVWMLLITNLSFSMWKVSKNWREIVVHDKHANRRRKLYIKQLRADAKVTYNCTGTLESELKIHGLNLKKKVT